MSLKSIYDVANMQCPNGCLIPMEEIKQDKIFYRNGEPIVITDLTMYVCPNCGQESMPLSSARLVEDVLNGKRNHRVNLLRRDTRRVKFAKIFSEANSH